MRRLLLLVLACAVLPGVGAAQMGDISQMSGIPLPTGELPAGSVSVRVVRGDLTNNLANQPVELHGGGQVWKATTDDSGRATFAGLAPGTSVHATTTVDGQAIESQDFEVPATGGVRLVLVARSGPGAAGGTVPGGTAAAPSGAASASAAPGAVVLAGQSRFVVEIVEEAVEVYVLMDIVNSQPTPVQPTEPLVFALPDEATQVTALEGSTPQGKVENGRVVVSGPFAPGRTVLQVAYRIPYASSQVAFRHVMPAPLGETSMLVRKVGESGFSSPQVTNLREMPMEGEPYYVGNGPGVPAGGVVEFSLTGLPYHSPIPRYLALALAVLIVVGGVRMAVSDGHQVVEDERRRLEARKDQLFGELVKLEEQHRAGRGDAARFAGKRAEVVEQLSQIYARLEALVPGLTSEPTGEPGVAAETSLRTHRA